MKDIWRNLGGPPKNKELWSYVVSFEFSRPKVAQTGIMIIYLFIQTDQKIQFLVKPAFIVDGGVVSSLTTRHARLPNSLSVYATL